MAAKRTKAKRTRQEARHDEYGAAFVVGAILGGAAGAVWTLFNAPRSGAETRAELARAVEAAVRGAGEAIARVRDRIWESGERAADRLALAIDAVTGGGPIEIGPIADRPAAATASSPSPVAAGSAATIDPATLAATDGATGDVPAGQPSAAGPAADGAAGEPLDRAPSGAANATA